MLISPSRSDLGNNRINHSQHSCTFPGCFFQGPGDGDADGLSLHQLCKREVRGAAAPLYPSWVKKLESTLGERMLKASSAFPGSKAASFLGASRASSWFLPSSQHHSSPKDTQTLLELHCLDRDQRQEPPAATDVMSPSKLQLQADLAK